MIVVKTKSIGGGFQGVGKNNIIGA